MTQIRIFDEALDLFKKEIPNLVEIWGVSDTECLQFCAADTMSKTFASRPNDWKVLPRTLCDDAVLGWRVEIDEKDCFPLPPGKIENLKEAKERLRHENRN